MAFPSSPTNGQIYKNYTYDSVANCWRNSSEYSSSNNFLVGTSVDNLSNKLQVNGDISIGTEPNVRWFQTKYNSKGNEYVPRGMSSKNGLTGSRSFSIWTNGYGATIGNESNSGTVFEFDGKDTFLSQDGGHVVIGSSKQIHLGTNSGTTYGVQGDFVNLISDDHGGFVLGSNITVKDGSLYNAQTHPTLSGTGVYIPGNGRPNQGSISFYTKNPGAVTAAASYTQTPSMTIDRDGVINAPAGIKTGLIETTSGAVSGTATLYGYKDYAQTSYVDQTSIVDTGIVVGGCDIYEVLVSGNTNGQGNDLYRSCKVGYILTTTTWNGSLVRTIAYQELASAIGGAGFGPLSVTAVLLSSGNEYTTTSDLNATVRIKVSGYNPALVGHSQVVRMKLALRG